MAMLVPYPTEFAEPAGCLYGHIRGDGSPRAHAVHAAYQLVGVGLGKFYPDPEGGPPGVGSPAVSGLPKLPADVSHEDGMAALKNLAEDGSTGVRGPITDNLIQLALAFALKKLQEWLGKLDADLP